MRHKSVVPAPMSITNTSSSMSRPYATENGSEHSITLSTDSLAALTIASLWWIAACAGTPITAYTSSSLRGLAWWMISRIRSAAAFMLPSTSSVLLLLVFSTPAASGR